MKKKGLINDYFRGSIESGNVVHVATTGNDEGRGTASDPFLHIQAAIDWAKLNFSLSDDSRVEIKIAPGTYEESITDCSDFITIQGGDYSPHIQQTRVILYNTGVDEAHYPINYDGELSIQGITVKVDPGGVYGKITRYYFFRDCLFKNGHFIERSGTTSGVYMDFRNCCFWGGSCFELTGIADSYRFIALRDCDMYGGEAMSFSSTGGSGSRVIKLDRSMVANPIIIGGDFSIKTQYLELYGEGKITIDTTGYIDIFSSTIINGFHFLSSPLGAKKIIACHFKDIVESHDITADVPVNMTEFFGNKHEKGLCGNIMQVGSIRNVGGNAGDCYATIQDAIDSLPTGSGTIRLFDDFMDLPALKGKYRSHLIIDGRGIHSLRFSKYVCLNEQDENIHFKNVILYGLVAIDQGGGVTLVNAEVHGGIIFLKDTLYYAYCTIDKSLVKSTSADPAIRYDSPCVGLKMKHSTVLGGMELTLGRTNAYAYMCAFDRDWPHSIENSIRNHGCIVDSAVVF